MTKITTIDRSALQTVADAFIKELETLADSFGLNISYAGGHYGGTGGTRGDIKLAIEVDDKAVTEKARKDEFSRYAGIFGLKSDDYGRCFRHGNNVYRLTGINPNAPKYPLVGEDIFTGKGFKFQVYAVKSSLLPAK